MPSLKRKFSISVPSSKCLHFLPIISFTWHVSHGTRCSSSSVDLVQVRHQLSSQRATDQPVTCTLIGICITQGHVHTRTR